MSLSYIISIIFITKNIDGDNMKTINDILASLSPEEKKLHSDLIAECISREENAIKSGKKLRKNIKTLVNINQNILNQLYAIQENALRLEKNAKQLNNQYNSYFLSNIPDNKFFKA